jgi:hypothetical protein
VRCFVVGMHGCNTEGASQASLALKSCHYAFLLKADVISYGIPCIPIFFPLTLLFDTTPRPYSPQQDLAAETLCAQHAVGRWLIMDGKIACVFC